ncbi:uncharacterized protein LOC116303886 [Actinia tenebrosa]|uniref:Uncharacterized protein LOC116303886 n=1 Tax=Actinia tenebrosa TaxID=6105 RepID=A0A6P8IQY8_ACTTE|nr:uncharacterized protein LOC116303886 [Actinia tenebrosa]
MTSMFNLRAHSAVCTRRKELDYDVFFPMYQEHKDMKQQGAYSRTPLLSLRTNVEENRLRPHTTTGIVQGLQNTKNFGLLFTPRRISYRVERALKHTENEKGLCLYKGKPRRMVVTERGIVQNIRPSATVNDTSLFSGATSAWQGDDTMSSSSQQTSNSNGTTLTETTESLSLMPGVFQDKNSKPRIFVRLRQLSSQERVMEWLYRSCNHPCKTLPLI